MGVEIVPLSPRMGAEVRGVDPSRTVDPETAEALRRAWQDHILLLFRGLELSDSELGRCTNWLGAAAEISMPVDRRGDDGQRIALISNIRDDEGRPIGALGDGDMWFHHDNCFEPEPDIATFLYGVEIPETGGNTLFGNCYLACDALPDRLKQAIEGRRVLQVYDYTVRGRPDPEVVLDLKHCWQPAVVVHPETRRRALYVDRLMTAAIEGYGRAESDALLDEICPYVERTDYEHVWRPGDLVVWDNRCSVHARTDFPEQARRLLKRGKVAGEALIPA